MLISRSEVHVAKTFPVISHNYHVRITRTLNIELLSEGCQPYLRSGSSRCSPTCPAGQRQAQGALTPLQPPLWTSACVQYLQYIRKLQYVV
jgi:hypothetical protein